MNEDDGLAFFVLLLWLYWWFIFRHRATISARTHVISCDKLIQRLSAADGALLKVARVNEHATDAVREAWWVKDLDALTQLLARDSRDVRQFIERLTSTASGMSTLVDASSQTVHQRLFDEALEDSNRIFTAFVSAESASIGYGLEALSVCNPRSSSGCR